MLQTTVIAKRTDESEPDTEEIRGLTEAAGARVLGEVTQTRPADPGTELGDGKVAELAELVEETGADTVVVDNELTPQQTVNLEAALGARVVDRHRVVLEIFADQARTRRAQLQVELARLKYRLPRVRERSDEGALNRFTESGTPYYDLLDRIDEIERKLKELPAVDEQHREQRREQGFDLVAIAGYTNAGKSTLLRRLADDMSLDRDGHDGRDAGYEDGDAHEDADAGHENGGSAEVVDDGDEEDGHPDLAETVGVEDRLFETLETTTRRATVEGRDVLLTDTVGFLDDLPHWLVESFRGTLREVEAADAVLLVADVAQPANELRRKLETTADTLGEDHPPVVTALNKADLVDDETLAERRDAVADVAPNPVPISAREDDDLSPLTERLSDVLPALERATVELPLTDDAMSLVSWLHDEATAADVEYGPDRAVVEIRARSSTVEKARAKRERL